MHIINNISYFFEIGGLKLLILKFIDIICKTNYSNEFIYNFYKASNPDNYPKLLKQLHKKITGTNLNLEAPVTFNEKIQWIKLYDSTPLKTILADKYLARNWIQEQIGGDYLIPLLGVWDRFDDIDFSLLPDKFVLKCNHGCGYNMIVQNKADLDIEQARKTFDKWMKTNFAFINGFELQYKDIPPKIIAEKYLESENGLIDYRFYCFSGKPTQCWVDMYSGTPNHIRSIYDMNWVKLPFRCKWPDGGETLSRKPDNFDLMKKIASQLSSSFMFVRVDFFEVNKKLYIGEMTFTPMNGYGRFEPKEWDTELGKLITLPSQKS